MKDLPLCCCAALTLSQYFRVIFHTNSLLCPLPKDKDAKELDLNSTRCWHNFFPHCFKNNVFFAVVFCLLTSAHLG